MNRTPSAFLFSAALAALSLTSGPAQAQGAPGESAKPADAAVAAPAQAPALAPAAAVAPAESPAPAAVAVPAPVAVPDVSEMESILSQDIDSGLKMLQQQCRKGNISNRL